MMDIDLAEHGYKAIKTKYIISSQLPFALGCASSRLRENWRCLQQSPLRLLSVIDRHPKSLPVCWRDCLTSATKRPEHLANSEIAHGGQYWLSANKASIKDLLGGLRRKVIGDRLVIASEVFHMQS
jgi:hypothetical protein